MNGSQRLGTIHISKNGAEIVLQIGRSTTKPYFP